MPAKKRFKTPEGYRAPLSRREAIEQFLSGCRDWSCRGGPNYDNNRWLFCFDVKLHRLNLDFDNLLKLRRESHPEDLALQDPVWLAGCRERLTETVKSNLCEWAIEIIASGFVDRNGRPGDDGMRMLWSGEPVDARFRFFGRSDGWLTLTDFDGWPLRDGNCLKAMDYKTLRRLYRYIVMLCHDLKHPEREVEHQASFDFFENLCADVTGPVRQQEAMATALARQSQRIAELLHPPRPRIDRRRRKSKIPEIVIPPPRRMITRGSI